MNRRDALGRFIARGARQTSAWIQGFRAATAGVAVGVGVNTRVGDVRIGGTNLHHHHQARAVHIQSPRHHSTMARRRTRSKRGRSRSKSRSRPRSSRKGFKRTGRRGGLTRKGHSKLVIGRQWPPSEMQATFTSNRDFQMLESNTTTTQRVSVFYLDSKVVSPGFTYFNADATGTATAMVSLEPRNWDFMTSLYKRARLISFNHRVEIMANSNVALQDNEYILCTWYSSDLDTTNPIIRVNGNALGTAAPWTAADEFRDILLQSRRVTKHRMKGPGMVGGRSSHIFNFSLGNQLKDRYGNVAIGGRHIRNVTNNPGGILHTTDKDVASALTQQWGVDNALCLAVFNAHDTNVNIPVALRITSTPTLLFYDRVLEPQVAP